MIFMPVFVWQNRELIRINPEEIVCLQAEKNYVWFHLVGKKSYMVRTTMESALEKLPPDIFLRMHRSFAVSVLFIKTVHNDHADVGGSSLPIGKKYYKALINKLTVVD